MNNAQKAQLYDEYIALTDKLQRENSKIKSDFAGNIPKNYQDIINRNEKQISIYVKKLEDLFKN